MVRLKVQEVAGSGMTLGRLQTQLTILLGESVYPATVRRYWYGTRDGRPDGQPLKMVDLELLGAIARVLGVSVCDLLKEPRTESAENEPGQRVPALMAA